jgi:hypothetical protein
MRAKTRYGFGRELNDALTSPPITETRCKPFTASLQR